MNAQQRPTWIGMDYSHDHLADQAHQFLQVELANGATTPSSRDNLLLERCTAHLMAISSCSRHTAETHAAQAIADLASRGSRVCFDMDRSTGTALFIIDRAANTTRVISAAELLHLMRQHESCTQPAP